MLFFVFFSSFSARTRHLEEKRVFLGEIELSTLKRLPSQLKRLPSQLKRLPSAIHK